MTRRFGFLVILVSAISAITAHASVPVGVYGIVDKVVLEPAGAEPQRAQVWGTFALWDEAAGLGYRTPQRGYLYYSCSREQLEHLQGRVGRLEVGCREGSGDRVRKPLAPGRARSRRMANGRLVQSRTRSSSAWCRWGRRLAARSSIS